MQLNHYNTKFKQKTFPIILVCDNVTNAPNIGSLFRISDAFGIEELIFCGDSIPIGRKMAKTSRATEKVVKHRVANSITDVVMQLKKDNYTIVSLEITDSSQAIHDFKIESNNKIAVIIGDENFGVNAKTLQESDAVVHVEMYGHNSSMNVVQATNIVLYELTKP